MSYEIKGLNEECGVFGVFGAENASQLTYFGLHSLQHRGQEGAGIVSSDGDRLHQHRELLSFFQHHSLSALPLKFGFIFLNSAPINSNLSAISSLLRSVALVQNFRLL